MGLWRRKGALDLERELRAARPEAPRELVEGIARKIAGERRSSGRGLRVGVAVALSAAMFAVLGAFGGLSYAANGVSRAVSSAVHVIAPVKPAKVASIPSVAYSSAMAQYTVAVCFNGTTLSIDSKGADSLLAKGATQGACKGGAFKPNEKLARACFKGQNITLPKASLTGVTTARAALARAQRALRDAIAARTAHSGNLSIQELNRRVAVWQRNVNRANRALADAEAAYQRLARLGIKPGFCKPTT